MANPRNLVANPNLEGLPAQIANHFQIFFFEEIAEQVAPAIMDADQYTEGVQKLIEAKDAFIRSVLP